MQSQLKYPAEQKVLDHINTSERKMFGVVPREDIIKLITQPEQTKSWDNLRFYRTTIVIEIIQSDLRDK